MRRPRQVPKYRREGNFMSIPQSASGSIQSRDDLVRHLSRGCRPKADWRIGTEHEKFVYDLRTHKPLDYATKPGIRQLLDGMKQFGWEPVLEGENIIGLMQNGASLSLEPGGQARNTDMRVLRIYRSGPPLPYGFPSTVFKLT